MQVDDTVNNRFVISKSVSFLSNGYTKALKIIPQMNNLLHTCTGIKNPEPYVNVSTVIYFLEYQYTGVLLTKVRMPVMEKPVT